MTTTPEPQSGDPNEITLAHQLDLLSDAKTLSGLKELGDAFIAGKLTKTINFNLKDPQDFRPSYPGKPDYIGNSETDIDYGFEADTRDPASTRDIKIEVNTNPDTPDLVELHGYRRPGKRYSQDVGQPGENKGIHMQVNYRLVENLEGQREVVFDRGLIYIQTSSDKLAYDAVIVIGEEGSVDDVLPPGDYHADRAYGSIVRAGEKAIKDKELPLRAVGALDQLEGTLEGVKLKHQRAEGEYAELQNEVASLLGIDVDKLMAGKVNVKATFEANLNEPLDIRPSLHGTGEITVPRIVFL